MLSGNSRPLPPPVKSLSQAVLLTRITSRGLPRLVGREMGGGNYSIIYTPNQLHIVAFMPGVGTGDTSLTRAFHYSSFKKTKNIFPVHDCQAIFSLLSSHNNGMLLNMLPVT